MKNAFINLKCSFLFDFLRKGLTQDCVIKEKEKIAEIKKSNVKKIDWSLNSIQNKIYSGDHTLSNNFQEANPSFFTL